MDFFHLEKIVFFFCLFNFGAFSLGTGLFFHRCAPFSPWSDKTHPVCLLPAAELQPEGDLLGAGIRGERVTPKKRGGNQVIDATPTDSAGQHFIICSVWGLNPKMSDISHQNMTVRPIYMYPYTSLGGVVATSEESHLEATHHFRTWRSGNYQTRFYLFFIFVSS